MRLASTVLPINSSSKYRRLGEASMADEVYQHPPPEESSPQGRLPEVEVPSSLAIELNIMTQGDLDRLRETYSFPLGLRMRLPGKGKTIIFVSASEVAFYEAMLSAGLRFPVHPTIKWILNFYGICPAQLSPNAWQSETGQKYSQGGLQQRQGMEEEIFLHLGRRLGVPFEHSSRGRGRTSFEVMGRVLRSWGTLGGIRVEAEDDIGGRAAASMGDARIIEKEMRRILPHVHDLDLLRWSGEKIRDPFLGPAPSSLSSSSNSRLGSQLDSRLSSELRSDAMSKRIKLSLLAKAIAPLPEAKKNKTDGGAHVIPARPLVLGEGNAAKSIPGEALGPHAFVMASATTAEKILAGVILPADKENVEKFTFDQVVTKVLHILGQGVILGSSLAIRSRDFVESANNHCALAESSKLEMVWAQNQAIELEGATAEANAREAKAAKEVEARYKEVMRLQLRVAELEKTQNFAKGRIIAAFKESKDFQEVVVGSASFYFGDGFNFCKKQLMYQYPQLGIDFEDIEMDHKFLAQVEAKADKKDGEVAEEKEQWED
ncbi:hypothetical protein Acr_04g0002460 [Actinidia rufa]|uniref:Uncharacterized protein n=1 Tax=Actinidia rufa TaxID=165716 RepID=A0A7J0EGA5_9ERIC|nr:hypothetical protein Acr_04g0002460 [Actinidia rufa]